jgi:integrase
MLREAGGDPRAAKAERQAAARREPDTVADVVNRFLARLTDKGRAPSYVENTKRNFENHFILEWGKRDIRTVTVRDVADLLRDVKTKPEKAGDKERPRGGRIAANRVLSAVQGLFNFARREGLIELSPAELADRVGKETRRERTLTAAEIAAVWQATKDLDDPFGPFFRLCLLTGQRREEVARMK